MATASSAAYHLMIPKTGMSGIGPEDVGSKSFPKDVGRAYANGYNEVASG